MNLGVKGIPALQGCFSFYNFSYTKKPEKLISQAFLIIVISTLIW
tara:strand:- start:36222 stop:36356 length:135 start_codon:yes stop_codon:yes gene_type:complete